MEEADLKIIMTAAMVGLVEEEHPSSAYIRNHGGGGGGWGRFHYIRRWPFVPSKTWNAETGACDKGNSYVTFRFLGYDRS